ncbi:hypothetical protein K1719_014387 [Acacia pycnantha]|nr:hypothetical protein K1719_014387 [Acacia pycnantha]
MAFIAKNSSLPSDHSSSHQFNDLDVAAPVHNSQVRRATRRRREENDSGVQIPMKKREEDEVEEEEGIIVADNSQEEDQGSNNGVWMTEEEEVEELNKKCQDFIRKMKAAFCSEPFNHHTSAMVTTKFSTNERIDKSGTSKYINGPHSDPITDTWPCHVAPILFIRVYSRSDQQQPIKYGNVFNVSGKVASNVVTPRDAALMQATENQALGQTQRSLSFLLQQNPEIGSVSSRPKKHDHQYLNTVSSQQGVV